MVGRTSSCPGTYSIYCIIWPIYLIHLRMAPPSSFLYHPFSPVTLLRHPTHTHAPPAHTHIHIIHFFCSPPPFCSASPSPFCAAAGYFSTTLLMLVLLLCLCTLSLFCSSSFFIAHMFCFCSPSPCCCCFCSSSPCSCWFFPVTLLLCLFS